MAWLPRALGALALASLLACPAWAADPVAYPGSSWTGEALLSAKIGGGKVQDLVFFDLDFGPSADPLLADDEFLLVLDDGMETLDVRGSYFVDVKGRPVFVLDPDVLAQELADLILHVCEDVLGLGAECDIIAALDVVFDASKQKLKVKGRSKDGVEMLKAAGKLPFELWDGEERVVRLSVSFKAVGEPAP